MCAWGWSHTQEAYDYAQAALLEWDPAELRFAIVEDESEDYIGEDLESFRLNRLEELRDLPTDILAAKAWEIAEKHQTCSNGGHTLYVDRNGWYGIDLP